MTENEGRTARTDALRALVELQVEPHQAAARLREDSWDSDEDLVTLTAADAVRVLNAYLSGQMDAADVQLWAEALEGRDDLGFDSGCGDRLKDFLFEFATPEVNEPNTPQLAERW